MENTIDLVKAQKDLVEKLYCEIVNKIDSYFKRNKNEFFKTSYDEIIEKTEMILKNYRNIYKANEKFLKEFKIQSDEIQSDSFENLMENLFIDKETEMEAILKTKYQTNLFLEFVKGAFDTYLNSNDDSRVFEEKKMILQRIYINGEDKEDFIMDYYDGENRGFYRHHKLLIEDMALMLFGIKGLKI